MKKTYRPKDLPPSEPEVVYNTLEEFEHRGWSYQLVNVSAGYTQSNNWMHWVQEKWLCNYIDEKGRETSHSYVDYEQAIAVWTQWTNGTQQ